MQRLNLIRAREIGNGSRHSHNAPMGPSRQSKFGQRILQEFLSLRFQTTIPLQESRLQLSIRVNPVLTIPVTLPIARRQDARSNRVELPSKLSDRCWFGWIVKP